MTKSPTGDAVALPAYLTPVAFVLAAMIAGGNAVAVRWGLSELAPFWGAATRYLAASAIMFAAFLLLRLSIPKGRELAGILLYGLLGFGLAPMFLYWSLQQVTAGTAMVAMALVPLFTLILASVEHVDRLSFRNLGGALVALGGIAFIFAEKVGAVSLVSLATLLAGAVSLAAVPVVVKRFPKTHPLVENCLGMAVGGLLLLAVSFVVAEPRGIPTSLGVQVSFGYLVAIGSISLFALYLFVLARWTASSTSYIMLLAPVSASVLGFVLLGEPITSTLVIGGLLTVAGVYLGAVAGDQTHPHGHRITH